MTHTKELQLFNLPLRGAEYLLGGPMPSPLPRVSVMREGVQARLRMGALAAGTNPTAPLFQSTTI